MTGHSLCWEGRMPNLLCPFPKALADPLLGLSPISRKGIWEDGMDLSVDWKAGLYYQIPNTDDLSG